MIIVLIFLFIFVAEYYVLLALVDIGLEYFIRALRKFRPFVTLILEIMIANIGVSIRNAYIISFVFQNSRNLI